MRIWGEKGRLNLFNKYTIDYILPCETEEDEYIAGNTTKELTGKYYELYCKNKFNNKSEVFNVGISEAKLIAELYDIELPPPLNIYKTNSQNNNITTVLNTKKNKSSQIQKLTLNIIVILNILKKSNISTKEWYKNKINEILKGIYSNITIDYTYLLKTINTFLKNNNVYLTDILQKIKSYEKVNIDLDEIIKRLLNKYTDIEQYYKK